MSGSPERPPQPPAVSVKGELSLSEKAPKLSDSETVLRALKGTNEKDIKDVAKDRRVLTRDIARLAKRLSKEEGRTPDVWHEVMTRVKSFEHDFVKELGELVTNLKEHPIGSDSEIDAQHFERMVELLTKAQNDAGTLFEVRRFYAPNSDRPLKKMRNFPLVGKNKFRVLSKFHIVSEGLSFAEKHHGYAFEKVKSPLPDEIIAQGESRKNTPPDFEIRDTSFKTLKSMQVRLAEFLRARDYLPEDRHKNFELTSLQIIDRMKRDYDVVQEAVERLEEFERTLEGITAMPDYEHAVGKLPEIAVRKLDKKLPRSNWLSQDVEGTDEYDLIPNPEKKISDKEKKKILEETQEMLVRLDAISKAYKTVIDACKDLRV